MAKLGEGRLGQAIDLGWREVGGLFYHDSNIAQPAYPRRGGYEVSKEIESPTIEEGSILDDRLKQVEMSRDDEGRDDRSQDLDRE